MKLDCIQHVYGSDHVREVLIRSSWLGSLLLLLLTVSRSTYKHVVRSSRGRGRKMKRDSELPNRKMHEVVFNLGFFFWWWGGSSTQALMPTYVSILRIPQMIWVWRATVEWYTDRGKQKNSGENPVPVPLYPPQTPHGLSRTRTRASAMRDRRLMTWAMARPLV
jgi:hypothetical protein